MRIDTLIESTLRNSQLKRVRIKVDPAQLLMQNFHMVDSYEGYILEEDGEDIKVFMLNLPDEFDPIQTVNRRHVSACKGNSQVTSKVLAQLEKEGISPDNPTYQKIKNTTSSDFIDQFLRELGYDDKKLIEFYKSMSVEPVTEGIASKLKDVGSNIKNINPLQAAQTVTGGLAKIPGLVVGRDNVIGRVAKFINPRGSGFMNVDSLIAGASKKYSEKDKNDLTKGTPIFVGGLPGFDVAGSTDDMDYQISGVVGKEEDERVPSSIKILNVYPLSVKNKYEVYIDFPTIYNPTKIGVLYLVNKTTGRIYKKHAVKVQDNKNRIAVMLDKARDDAMAKAEASAALSAGEKRIIDIDTSREKQERIAEMVQSKLKDYIKLFNAFSWSEQDIESIFSKTRNIVTKIIEMGESDGIAALEKVLEPLARDRKLVATTNPQVAVERLFKDLKDSNLLNI